ncbi:MAG: response regulator [Nostoc sp. ZfuVER08]|uniref:histidine kinase n=1 Tax=Nostoc punctiforme FACHB-252 TaxID=1357509 RepID=A0ABR8HAX6_NOSPU|nr:response regulator [Nostoc punctiforme]MBD2612746.1 response regulator [Nostoc punctiforme FACHB-252]MDZ8011026.1 response regulator [Nostoc sp. ZfuVER08]
MSELQVTILHVDDNEANRYVVNRILQNAGFTVVEAATGAAGLEAVAEHQPALVILDVKLPDLSGFEVCRQIKANPKTNFIPVLHLSATFIQSQDKVEGLDSGADAYLAQPVEPIELVATVRSLLRIRRAEESALSSAREWQSTFDSINDGVSLVDRQGRILRCNRAMMELVGKRSSEILGRLYHELIKARWGIGDGTCFRRAKETHQRQVLEFQSQERWFAKTIDPAFNQQGTLTGAVFILSDITERKRIEDERKQAEIILQERNQRLDLLYETTQELLSSYQPLTLIGSLFKKLKGLLELDVYFNYLIDSDRNQLHLTSYEGIDESIAQEIEWLDYGQAVCGTVAQCRNQIVCAGIQNSRDPKTDLIRSLLITAYSCQPLIARGHLFGTLSFGSRRREQFTFAETNLMQALCDQMAIALDRAQLLASLQQQADQLRQANRIKDEFLAVLSHELRSPLNPILGWAKILQTTQPDTAKSKYALETIERNAKLQAQLIEDLLDVSRILQGKLSLNTLAVNLTFTIKAALETVRLAAEAKSIQIETIFEPNVGEILGDPARLQQVIWNLLANAIKFTPQGGRVKVQLSKVAGEVGGREQGAGGAKEEITNAQCPIPNAQSPVLSYAQVTVSDSGRGISGDFLPYVFDYFRQADGTTTRKFGGLGLGLAIVRHLVELHGGTIEAASPGEGQGSTFTVKLPLIAAAKLNQDDTASDNSSDLNLNGLQALLVDDDRDSREFIAFLLEHYGVQVTEANSASEALSSLGQTKFDLLISDIGMPDVDGYTLIRQIRKHSPDRGGEIPAIALTAYAGESDRQQALAAGFQEHISKPIEPEELMQAILTILRIEPSYV